MVNVTTHILINQPLSRVAAFSSNPDNAPLWYVNIDSAEWKTPPPLKTGSRILFKARFLGKKLVYTYEVIEWVPAEKLVMRTADGPFPMRTTYTWKALDDTTTYMELNNQGNPSGFSAMISPFMSWMMKRANNKDLSRLKKIVETGAT